MLDRLETGEYRYVTDRTKAQIMDWKEYDGRLMNVINRYGYEEVMEKGDVHAIFDRILTPDQNRLVTEVNRGFAEVALAGYPNRSRFWLIQDEEWTQKWSCFMWRKDFPLADQFNRALIMIADFKYVSRRFGHELSELVTGRQLNEKLVRLEHDYRVGLRAMKPLVTVYAVGIALAAVVGILELVIRRKRQAIEVSLATADCELE